jgi:hypothetical protein
VVFWVEDVDAIYLRAWSPACSGEPAYRRPVGMSAISTSTTRMTKGSFARPLSPSVWTRGPDRNAFGGRRFRWPSAGQCRECERSWRVGVPLPRGLREPLVATWSGSVVVNSREGALVVVVAPRAIRTWAVFDDR